MNLDSVKAPRIGHRRGGFTLIEVMVALILTALLLIGLNSLWWMAAGELFRLTLRQQAVLALSGETVRLAELYAVAAPRTALVSIAGEQRLGYAADFAAFGVVDDDGDFTAGEIRVLSPSNENIVWLDADLGIVARFSWQLDESGLGSPETCPMLEAEPAPSVAGCARLVSHLDYPFRYRPGEPPAEMAPVRSLTLQTVVGRRAD